jgi:hypothetical protein
VDCGGGARKVMVGHLRSYLFPADAPTASYT